MLHIFYTVVKYTWLDTHDFFSCRKFKVCATFFERILIRNGTNSFTVGVEHPKTETMKRIFEITEAYNSISQHCIYKLQKVIVIGFTALEALCMPLWLGSNGKEKKKLRFFIRNVWISYNNICMLCKHINIFCSFCLRTINNLFLVKSTTQNMHIMT